MATPFSWSDTIQITFGTCLPCIKPRASTPSAEDDEQHHNHNPAINRIPRARPDELQGLLADPDTDVEAETMSLHSNPGRGQRRKRTRKSKKGSSSSFNNPRKITLFGYDLFGHTTPPIQLPDDGEDALYPDSEGDTRSRRGRGRNGSISANTIVTAHSTASTFDSDAAPLDADTIDALSSPTAAATAIEAAAQAAAAAEAQRLREKEERRQKRREKKEMRRFAEAQAMQGAAGEGVDGEFEGFQGSGGGGAQAKAGSGYPRIPNTMYPASDSGSGSAFSGSANDGFGRFVSAPPAASGLYVPRSTAHDDDDDAADLDGGLYARKSSRDGKTGSGGGGSDSRSMSTSDRGHAHQFTDPRNVFKHVRSHSQSLSQSSSSRMDSPSASQAQFQFHSQSESQQDLDINSTHQKTAKKSKSKMSSSSRTTQSRSSASQSPSLPSPVSSAFPAAAGVVQETQSQNQIVSPSTIEQGQGFFDLEDEVVLRKSSAHLNTSLNATKPKSEFPSTRIGGGGGGGGFPITGFGGGASGGGAKRTRDFGAFLARRGDDDDDDGGDGL